MENGSFHRNPNAYICCVYFTIVVRRENEKSNKKISMSFLNGISPFICLEISRKGFSLVNMVLQHEEHKVSSSLLKA